MLHSYERRYDYLPDFYREILEANEIIDAQAESGLEAYIAIQDALSQFFVETATTGLKRWEAVLGLPIKDSTAITWDENDTRLINEMEGKTWNELEYDYEVRRSAILARLRGFGVVTKQTIIDMADQYTGGAITVTEHFSEYRVTIEFIDAKGVPKGIDDLKKVIREALPAHILIEYKFKYQTFNELDARNWTWDQLDAANLTWDQFDSYGT